MTNGIEVDANGFANMDRDDQMNALFQAIVTTNTNFCKQVPLCEAEMDKKITAERKRKNRINIGLGGGAGAGAYGLMELIRNIPKLWNGSG